MKKCKSLAAFLLCLAAAVTLLPVTALGAGAIDLSHSNSLTVTAVYDKKPISGMQFDAYLISTVDSSGELTPINRFQSYQEDLDIRGKNDEAWQEMARVLAREVTLDTNLKPSRSAVTDSDGVAKFTDIPMGLYLVIGNGAQKNDLVYTTLPFFALLPEQDLSSNTWNYHIVAKSKPQPNPVLDDFEVIKIWDDKCHKNEQHKPITIQLICDGEVYDTITLPYEGAWKYTWYQLEVNHVWTVQEPEKVDGYKDADIRQEGNTFIVTNTCNRPTTQPTQPGKPTLPQTGQLWWPVPVLIAAGLLFVVIGLIRRRGIADEK